jgi:hypothetical protein
MDEKQRVPTADFEWDSTFFGGNYESINSSTTQVPVAFIERLGNEEDAFERFTHVHRCHIISVAAEESEAYGHGKSQNELEAEQRYMQAFAKEHAPVCAYCESLAKLLQKERDHEHDVASWEYDRHCRCRLCRAFEVSQERYRANTAFRSALLEKPEFLRSILEQEC